MGKTCVVAAWAGLALALLSPPRGSGAGLCWWQNTIGLPCLGCGITRSLSCALHGLFAESLRFHPMGILILPLFLFTAMHSLLPRNTRTRISDFLDARPQLFNTAYLAFISLFVAFGTLRSTWHLLHLSVP